MHKNIQNNYTYRIFTGINLAVDEFLRKKETLMNTVNFIPEFKSP